MARPSPVEDRSRTSTSVSVPSSGRSSSWASSVADASASFFREARRASMSYFRTSSVVPSAMFLSRLVFLGFHRWLLPPLPPPLLGLLGALTGCSAAGLAG